MEFYDILQSRRSIRKYQDRPVDSELLERIFSAALRSSSSGNMQAYSVILTQDPELKRQLHKPHFEQDMVVEAPVLVTFCADFHRMREWLKLREAPLNFDNPMSFMIGAIDAILAAQTAALAAENEGLGICFLGTTLASCYEIGEILGCPKHVLPVAGFTLGYPAENPKPRDRLPLRGLIHHDTYRAPGPAEIARTYDARETAGWERYMAVPELRAMIEKSGVKNLAQVYTTVKYTRQSHQEYSRTILRALERADFLNAESFADQ